ncbi:MAG: hypothetical protein V3W43_04120 [Desulfatiglandaceae bacterium]
MVENAVLLADAPMIFLRHLGEEPSQAPSFARTLCSFKENYDTHLVYVYVYTKGNTTEPARARTTGTERDHEFDKYRNAFWLILKKRSPYSNGSVVYIILGCVTLTAFLHYLFGRYHEQKKLFDEENNWMTDRTPVFQKLIDKKVNR